MFTREELKEIQILVAKEEKEMCRFKPLMGDDKEWSAKWEMLQTIYNRILDTL